MNHRDRGIRKPHDRGPVRPAALSAQLVFFHLHGTSVTLDTLVVEPTSPWSGSPAVGVPIALEVSVPPKGWERAALNALSRWADDGRPLEISARQGVDGPQLQITDGETAMLLDLV